MKQNLLIKDKDALRLRHKSKVSVPDGDQYPLSNRDLEVSCRLLTCLWLPLKSKCPLKIITSFVVELYSII